MRQIEGLLPRLAASRSAVLITGESGVGKEEVARALHRAGDADGMTPFVAVNCGAIPEHLIESELFGHEKGAFTGAVRERRGVFEQADGGTLFLDEIGEMPLAMQVKLLRAIQERAVVPVGSERARPVDIRLVCATHRDLKAMVETGAFREDLFYRIHVVHLPVPPLRERQEDILWLADRFLDEISARGGVRLTLTPDVERALPRYPWPGNVRELRHCLERASILSPLPQLGADSLFGASWSQSLGEATEALLQPLGEYLQECERGYIRRALAECNGRITDTAAQQGGRTSLASLPFEAESEANRGTRSGRVGPAMPGTDCLPRSEPAFHLAPRRHAAGMDHLAVDHHAGGGHHLVAQDPLDILDLLQGDRHALGVGDLLDQGDGVLAVGAAGAENLDLFHDDDSLGAYRTRLKT
jgi:DNA-binding NtrC family response regulator